MDFSPVQQRDTVLALVVEFFFLQWQMVEQEWSLWRKKKITSNMFVLFSKARENKCPAKDEEGRQVVA